MKKVRLDQLVVQRGLAPSREKAQRLILAGAVRVNGEPATKPGHAVSDDPKVVDKAFSVTVTGTSVWLPKVMSRKKQVVPNFEKAFA